MTTVTAGVNLDITGLVNPQFSITAVEASAPQVVVTSSLRSVCCDRVQPSPSGTDRCRGDDPEHSGNPSCAKTVIVQEIPQVPVVGWIPEQIVETIEVLPQEQIEGQITDIPVPQEQLIAEVTTLNTSSTSTSSSSTSTSSDLRLNEFANMLDSCIELLTPVTAQID